MTVLPLNRRAHRVQRDSNGRRRFAPPSSPLKGPKGHTLVDLDHFDVGRFSGHPRSVIDEKLSPMRAPG